MRPPRQLRRLRLRRRRVSANALAAAIVVAGAAYLLVTAWAMAHVAYDVWGALIAAPIIAAVLIPLARYVLRAESRAVRRVAMVGLAAKLGGALARYWVAFDAYGGEADSAKYHALGKVIAGDAHEGKVTALQLVPHTQGTEFIDELTGFLYTFVGSSKLAGFLWFAALGYVGVLLSFKAASIAVPKLLRRRYALLCFLMPSIVFWPSGIGKEAWMSLCLGAVSMGAARLFRGGNLGRAALWLSAGAGGAAMVRPHMAGIWLAGVVLALVWAVVTGRVGGAASRGSGRRVLLVAFAAVAIVSLIGVAKLTLTYLNPPSESEASVRDQVENVLDLTTRRTSGGGSELDPIIISGPSDYPTAVVRTLTRPLLYEATSLATLLPALEMTLLLCIALRGWRSVAALPGQLLRNPFVLYSALVCVMFGLAFSSLANLAILIRQRSLVMPALVLICCLPPWRSAASRRPALQVHERQRPVIGRRPATVG